MGKNVRHFAKWASAVFLLDRVTKMIVQIFFEEGQSIPVIKNVFHFTYYRNPGAAFNVLAYRRGFFIVIALVVLMIIIYYYNKVPLDKHYVRTALALEFGGVSGNLFDRVIEGYVVDFLDFRIWPVFNIADTAIVIGVILLSWQILTWPEEEVETREH